MDSSPLGSSVHGISQARILEWDVISFSRGSSRPRDWTLISCIGRQVFHYWATWEAHVLCVCVCVYQMCIKHDFIYIYVCVCVCCCCCSVTSVVSNSVQPHRRQPTRLPCPWDSPGKNTGVGCHFLLQCMKVRSESEVAQLCPTLRDPMDCSLPGSSVHGIFQARVLDWGAITFSKYRC